ncbi:hypothetical protein V22_08330 [Calycomorphotria hydatis]|uniref:JAB domain-containing protein n=1 Tax=Calycomorphotria hydatis TaxID=2528027 RepID=A0A517T5F8_9PLAN|nr:hypothetical protein V22_08330 [Calycomorphotria hydatis]
MGGFGISHPEDFLFVTDIQLVKQHTSYASVAFDDDAVADFFDEQVDRGLMPAQFGRIWMHTHPSSSALPSPTDEETFARVFGRTDWAVMFILAQEGQTYARLRYRSGPAGEFRIRTTVDYSVPFECSRHPEWEEEYLNNVLPEQQGFMGDFGEDSDLFEDEDWEDMDWIQWDNYMERISS